jgi:iron complex transport system ATP-binding protein
MLAKDRGLAVLMASHDINLAGAHADRMIVLDHGKIAAQGSPAEVLRGEVLAPVFEVEMETIERASGMPVVIPK